MVAYSRMNATATRLLRKNGRAVTVVKRADGTLPDAAKPWNPGARTEVEYDTKGVFYPVTERFVDGTVVRWTDEEVLIAHDLTAATPMPADLELTAKDLVLDGAHTCAVVKSMPIAPGSSGVVLHCVVRRGP